VPRSTLDADFVVEMHAGQRQWLFESLAAGFEPEPQMAFETVAGKTRHRLRHRSRSFSSRSSKLTWTILTNVAVSRGGDR
jgi:hypothetical protein